MTEFKVNNKNEMVQILKDIASSKTETEEDFSVCFSMYDFLPQNYKNILDMEQPSYALSQLKDEHTVELIKQGTKIHATINFGGSLYWLSKTFYREENEEDMEENIVHTIQSQALTMLTSHFNIFQKISDYLCSLNKLNTQQEVCLKLWEMGADSEHPFKDVALKEEVLKVREVVFNTVSQELVTTFVSGGDLNLYLYKYEGLYYVRVTLSYIDEFGCKWLTNVGYYYPELVSDWCISLDLGILKECIPLIDIINAL